MKYIKLFENFNNEVQYFVNRVGDSYRIFAITPKMKTDGVKEPQDAESLFGKGSFWVDYDSYEAAKSIVNSLSSEEPEEQEDYE